jgi:chemotaxis protein histidine kinase CheA
MVLDTARFMTRFVGEARDHVTKLNDGLVRLEKDPGDEETINSVFRSAHTIKGSARMMKLGSVADVAHRVEDALGALRERRIRHSRDLADVLFRGIDTIAGLIEDVAAGRTPAADTAAICAELARAAEGMASAESPGPAAPAVARNEEAPDVEGPVPPPSGPALPLERGVKPGAGETVRVEAERLDELFRLMGEIVSHQSRLKRRLSEVRDVERVAERNALAAKRLAGETAGTARENALEAAALHELLERLGASMRDDAALQELLTSELQEKALVLRMLPLATVFDTLPRAVRDLARSLGKEVDLVVEGGEIGLDKKLMERIGDPLLHLLRNAVDHGIENPEERRRAGKPERGRIRLSAAYDAGSVVIDLEDDGGGIAVERIREKALKQRLYGAEELAAMPETELVNLIFRPAFSTSRLITDLSGRGVGLDVVKRAVVDEMKGSVRVDTRSGGGTRFSLRLPMTLALMRVLKVSAAGSTYAIDVHAVSEILRHRVEEIIPVLGKKAIRHREELMPVVRLDGVLSRGAVDDQTPAGGLILIVRMGAEKLGLIVDTLIDEEDAVVKALPPHMARLPLVAGVTISGGAEVLAILHVPGIFQAARDLEGPARAREREEAVSRRILVVDDSVNTREIEKGILEAYGYVVDLAEDGMDAVEKVRKTQYDLVVTDVEMPRLDGFSLTLRLRQDERYRDTPIIIVTSREKDEDKKRGLSVGANAYIVKGSFDQTNLLETVQNLIG